MMRLLPRNTIKVDWPVPGNVHAYSTLRSGGISDPPYSSWNLAMHVGDAPEVVAENRAILEHELNLPATPLWLQQVHGNRIVDAATAAQDVQADGSFTEETGVVCAVMTADCLPVLISNRKGSRIAAVHAGWRGLAGGVIEAALERFPDGADEIIVWLGPAIGPRAFEVGNEVRDIFIAQDEYAEDAFQTSDGGKWMADLYLLARIRLARRGIRHVYGGGLCTYSEPNRFFSYRRDQVTGRMVSLIWMEL